MDLTPYDFELPERLIALRPVEPRTSARLLVVHGDGQLEDAHIRDLPDLLPAGSMLVFNDTRVLQAALSAIRPARDESGSDVEVSINLVELETDGSWKALARPGKRLRVGDRLEIADGFWAEITAKDESGQVTLAFNYQGAALMEALEANADAEVCDLPAVPTIIEG